MTEKEMQQANAEWAARLELLLPVIKKQMAVDNSSYTESLVKYLKENVPECVFGTRNSGVDWLGNWYSYSTTDVPKKSKHT